MNRGIGAILVLVGVGLAAAGLYATEASFSLMPVAPFERALWLMLAGAGATGAGVFAAASPRRDCRGPMEPHSHGAHA